MSTVSSSIVLNFGMDDPMFVYERRGRCLLLGQSPGWAPEPEKALERAEEALEIYEGCTEAMEDGCVMYESHWLCFLVVYFGAYRPIKQIEKAAWTQTKKG